MVEYYLTERPGHSSPGTHQSCGTADASSDCLQWSLVKAVAYSIQMALQARAQFPGQGQ